MEDTLCVFLVHNALVPKSLPSYDRAVRSLNPDTTRLPSPLIATPATDSLCPLITPIWRSVSTPFERTVSSAEPDTKRLHSSHLAALFMQSVLSAIASLNLPAISPSHTRTVRSCDPHTARVTTVMLPCDDIIIQVPSGDRN